MLSIEALMKSGVKYDDKNPVLCNVIFDIERENQEVNSKIHTLNTRIRNCNKNLNEFNDFKSIKVPNTSRYNQIIDELSELLFDEITYSRIVTCLHVEWKEYFHSLYDLVVIAHHHDRTHYIQMINETYKYYGALEKPAALSPRDSLYVDFKSCEDLLEKLKQEHARLIIPKLFKKIKRHFEILKKKRINYMNLQLEMKSLVKQRIIFLNILNWASISSS